MGELCHCIYEAHCSPKRPDCKLAAGGTVNDGGGVCPPKGYEPQRVERTPEWLAGYARGMTAAEAFGDAPEWEKANATLKHRVRELEAERDQYRNQAPELWDTVERISAERDELRAERDSLKAELRDWHVKSWTGEVARQLSAVLNAVQRHRENITGMRTTEGECAADCELYAVARKIKRGETS